MFDRNENKAVMIEAQCSVQCVLLLFAICSAEETLFQKTFSGHKLYKTVLKVEIFLKIVKKCMPIPHSLIFIHVQFDTVSLLTLVYCCKLSWFMNVCPIR